MGASRVQNRREKIRVNIRHQAHRRRQITAVRYLRPYMFKGRVRLYFIIAQLADGKQAMEDTTTRTRRA